MFIFEKCSYDELQRIRQKENLTLMGWKIIKEAYIDETKKIYDKDGTLVALINYYFLGEKKEKMMIALFEVFKQYRRKGIGKRIISQFLKDYYGEIYLEPSSEEGRMFWEKCEFASGCYLDRRCK